MKTFKQYIIEGYAKADGRWSSFTPKKLVYKAKMMRVYSGLINNNEMFETQVILKRKWVTIQYSDNLKEAISIPTMDDYDRKYLQYWKGFDEIKPEAPKSENFKTHFDKSLVMEVPLPQDWDQETYSPKVSFAKQVKYAMARAAKLGTGSSRVVFDIQFEGRPTALKIAKNPKGLAQNEKEADYGLYRMYPDITIPLIDYDEKNSPPHWIHVEKAEKLTKPKFKSITGYSFDDFGTMLHMDENRRHAKPLWGRIPEETKEKIENSELYYDVTSLMGNFDILAGDLSRLANWGIYQGRPVVIDLGFSSDIQKLHYSR